MRLFSILALTLLITGGGREVANAQTEPLDEVRLRVLAMHHARAQTAREENQILDRLPHFFFNQDADGSGDITERDHQIRRLLRNAQRRAMGAVELLDNDLDADGRITEQEFANAAAWKLRTRGGVTAGKNRIDESAIVVLVDNAMRVFHQRDLNGDGVLTLDEALEKALSDFPPERPLRNTFSPSIDLSFDRDRDARVNLEEFVTAARAVIEPFDTDDDGLYSQEERNAFAQAARESRKTLEQRDSK